jgi:hypothetical protein
MFGWACQRLPCPTWVILRAARGWPHARGQTSPSQVLGNQPLETKSWKPSLD